MNLLRTSGSMMLISLFAISISAAPEGAFTSLHVKAKDVDKYVNFMKENTAPFQALGADVAGVCVTRSGNQYPGEMFVWSAYPSIEAAYEASRKYDPLKPSPAFEELRTVLYSVTWKPVKEFALKPGYERLWRLKLNDWKKFAFEMEKLETALSDAGHDMRLGVFYPLGGGTEVFHLRAVTDTPAQSGKIADEYFAGASYGKIWDNAFKYVDAVVSETVEECEIIYTKD
jgi:hypothetical protein